MNFLRAMYMNPATGRFLTLDDYEGNRFDPISLHKYLYADLNPINKFDPTGQFTITEQQLSIAIAAINVAISSISLYNNTTRALNPRLSSRERIIAAASGGVDLLNIALAILGVNSNVRIPPGFSFAFANGG